MRYCNKSNHRQPGLVLLLLGLTSAISFAHPMGNLSINHYAKIKIDKKWIEIRYLIDMAEIPTFQEIREFGITPPADDPAGSHYLDRQDELLKEGISWESDGRSVRL